MCWGLCYKKGVTRNHNLLLRFHLIFTLLNFIIRISHFIRVELSRLINRILINPYWFHLSCISEVSLEIRGFLFGLEILVSGLLQCIIVFFIIIIIIMPIIRNSYNNKINIHPYVQLLPCIIIIIIIIKNFIRIILIIR